MKLINKILLSMLAIFIFGGLIGYYYLQQTAWARVKDHLGSFSQEIVSDLHYDNGRWDTSLYNADPNTPHPNGSSGFSNPLYIFTTDGLVIERNRPLAGLLDSSDFKRLVNFQSPTTLETATNENWRVLSLPVTDKGKTIGVIFTSIYNPIQSDQAATDLKLLKNSRYINSKLQIKDGDLKTQQVDVRNIDYDVSFEVVTSFNKVLASNGRVPTLIDSSYIYDQLRLRNTIKKVIDSTTGVPFLVQTTPVLDKDKNIVGVIVLGESIENTDKLLWNFIVFFGLFAAVTIGMGLFLLNRWIPTNIGSLPSKISFDKEKGLLKIDKKTIQIPYASNQYYLCEALFSHPQKRWEQDFLLKRFGENENSNGWRKIYDAALAINKKANYKIVENRDKTFQLNPQLLKSLK